MQVAKYKKYGNVASTRTASGIECTHESNETNTAQAKSEERKRKKKKKKSGENESRPLCQLFE